MPTFAANSTGRSGTIQSWTVPATAKYKIECWGAQGGRGVAGGNQVPGKGAYRHCSMNLTAGETIKIIAGQEGGNNQNYEGGGGGGTFVYRETGSDLLCAAGGGGGASYSGPGRDGVVGTSGTPGYNSGSDYGTAGTSGSGGSGGYAASGGGWTGNGGESGWSSGNSSSRPGSASKPGLTYVTGQSTFNGQAIGGEASTYSPQSTGGFGGGAGTHGNYIGGGGAGGYSGGAGGYSAWGGGGGGSFVHASALADGGTSGARVGHGQAVITLQNDRPVATITAPTAGQKIDPRIPLQMTWNYSDNEAMPQSKYEISWPSYDQTPGSLVTHSPTSTQGRSGTIQSWTVTTTGVYRIVARGSSGQWNGTLNGGLGAVLTGEFLLFTDDVIQILVGQRGDTGSISTSAGQGGGGGSFVYNQTTGTLLLAAGGGGGPGGTTLTGYQGCDASLTTAPNNRTSAIISGYADATPGNGGNDGNYGGAGAGWLTNGQGASNSGAGLTQGYRMLDAISPGLGGYGYSSQPTVYAGGFGGGGGGSSSADTAGGGGGYTGGNGGSATDYPGGGGGSYNAGTNPSAILHTSYTDAGLVTIQKVGSSSVEFMSSDTSYTIAANSLVDETQVTLYLRVRDDIQWSLPASVAITSDSWTYGSEVNGAIQTGVDLPELDPDLYEAQVRTSDSQGYGPWSSTASFQVLPTSSTKIRESGAWRTVPLFVRVGGQWVALKKRRMP